MCSKKKTAEFASFAKMFDECQNCIPIGLFVGIGFVQLIAAPDVVIYTVSVVNIHPDELASLQLFQYVTPLLSLCLHFPIHLLSASSTVCMYTSVYGAFLRPPFPLLLHHLRRKQKGFIVSFSPSYICIVNIYVYIYKYIR